MQTAEKLSITLPSDMVRIIRDKVGGGGYGSNSEVIREAMRGWIDREKRLALLDKAIATGLADADAGRLYSVDSVRAELKGRIGQSNPSGE